VHSTIYIDFRTTANTQCMHQMNYQSQEFITAKFIFKRYRNSNVLADSKSTKFNQGIPISN